MDFGLNRRLMTSINEAVMEQIKINDQYALLNINRIAILHGHFERWLDELHEIKK